VFLLPIRRGSLLSNMFRLFLVLLIALSCIPYHEPPKLTSEEIELSFSRGRLYYDQGDYGKAIDELSGVARSLASVHADDAQLLLARCYYALDDYSAALKEVVKLEKRFPDSPLLGSAKLVAAESYLARGELAKAGAAYVDALALTRDERTVDAILTQLGRLSGRLSLEELYALRKRCRVSSAKAIILLSIAERETKRGEGEAARAVLTELLQLETEAKIRERAQHLMGHIKAPGAARIGMIAPLSGEYSIYGDALRRGIELALSKYRNAELVVFDSRGDPVEAVRGVAELAQGHHVIAIIGPVFTRTAIPAAVKADYLGIPLISPTATDERIGSLGEYIFQLDNGLRHQAVQIANYAVQKEGFTKFAIIYPEDGYGRSLTTAFSLEVKRLGGEIVVALPYESEKTDFKEEIDTLKVYTPDVIFIPAYADDVIMISTQLRYYEVEVPLLGGNGWKSLRLLALAGEYVEGGIFSAFDVNPDTSDIGDQFARMYRERYGEDPMKQSAQGFDAARLIAKAIALGVDNPRALRDYLDAGVLSVGASGLIYTAKQPSSDQVRLYRVHEGRVEEIPWWRG